MILARENVTHASVCHMRNSCLGWFGVVICGNYCTLPLQMGLLRFFESSWNPPKFIPGFLNIVCEGTYWSVEIFVAELRTRLSSLDSYSAFLGASPVGTT